jgi:dihydroorotate dehydrogenase
VIYRRVVRPLLFRSYDGDAEQVHEHTLAALARLGAVSPARGATAALLGRHRRPVRLAGIDFPGLVGLAAGMDKDGLALRSWAALGFGHVELGTVTARPQPGNDRPRVFRLPSSTALINRMGFNNLGAQALADRLHAAGVRRGNGAAGLPIGVSIGKTRTTPLAEAVADYTASFTALARYADYVAVNVSSPNTPGLRALQDADALGELTAALVGLARQADPARPLPVFVKLAPDLSESALKEALAVCAGNGVAGLIATNTTLARHGIAPSEEAIGEQAGGLSGAPLTLRAREVVRFLRDRTDLPIIGVGGILDAADGQAMLDAGADLLQVYTGFVYAGPGLVDALNRRTGAR